MVWINYNITSYSLVSDITAMPIILFLLISLLYKYRDDLSHGAVKISLQILQKLFEVAAVQKHITHASHWIEDMDYPNVGSHYWSMKKINFLEA